MPSPPRRRSKAQRERHEAKRRLVAEAGVVLEEAAVMAIAHQLRARLWSRLTAAMVLAGVLLALIGGIGAVVAVLNERVAGAIAIAAATVTSLPIPLESIQKALDHQTASARYNELTWAIGTLVAKLGSDFPVEHIDSEWERLDARRQEVFAGGPDISVADRAYRRAQKLRMDQRTAKP